MNYRFKTLAAWVPVAAAFSLVVATPAAASKPAPKTAKEKVVVATESGESAGPAPKSTFTIDKDFRDPFFPKASKSSHAAASSAKTAPTPANVQSALRAGFQGVLGAGDRRLAMINNVILEAGHKTVIPVRIGNSQQKVEVEVVEVLRNGVVLEVQGQKEPLTVTYAESR